MEEAIKKLHNLFFKGALKNKQVAQDLLLCYLPAQLCKRINFETLKPTDKSFVRQHLREFHSDIIYTCLIDGKPSYIYFIIEYQSDKEELMAFRKFQYNVALMEDHLTQGHKKLPLIINCCIYHGKKAPYPYSVDIYDCFEIPELARKEMFQSFKLIDLTIMSEENLKKHGTASLVEMLFKHRLSRSYFNVIKRVIELGLLQAAISHLGDSYLEHVLEYVLNVGEDTTHVVEDILSLLKKALPAKEKVIMKFAEQLRQQGVKTGRQRGIEQERRAIAKKMLKQGFKIETIAQVTRLSQEQLKKLK